MTVIAYRDGIIAGDRNALINDVIVTQRTKVARADDGTLIGAAGSGWRNDDFRKWAMDAGVACQDAEPPRLKSGVMSGLLVYPDGRIEVVETEGDETQREWYGAAPFAAIGIGTDLALGAMAAGATAIEAALIACRFHVKCGGGVDWIDRDGNRGRSAEDAQWRIPAITRAS